MATGDDLDVDVSGDIVAFRPVDCGVQPLSTYEFPFIGLTVKLSQTMLDKRNSRDVFVMPFCWCL